MSQSTTEPAGSHQSQPERTVSIYDRFEAAWRSAASTDSRPCIKDYLRELPEPERLSALRTFLILDLRCRQENGEEPSLTLYRQLFPEYPALIHAVFEEMGMLRRPEAAPPNGAFDQHTGPYHPINDTTSSAPVTSRLRGRSATSGSEQGAGASGHAALPQLPCYEVLEQLGEGGMGVVYKARDLKLKRLVALKMIRPGRGPTQDETRKKYFFAEAEAVAKFQHPNLVQIYEIGEFDGQPYFSLELLDGGNLSEKLEGTPQPAAQAAALVETLARTVDYAHQKGVIHRDLKPANILLTSDGTPKIADFGLAKQLVPGSASGEEGNILGTPSYMAPEQARGENNEVGPLADIYALGAILYEMLTGRPPFKAASKWHTIQQVRNQEIVPPRLLVPQVPRDLELICLRCLQKDASKRFATARDLADDLRRYQEHRPIDTRPAPLWERAWKWCRRQPAAASLIAVSVLALTSLLLYLDQRARGAQRELREQQRTSEMRTKVQELHLKAQEAVDRNNPQDAQGRLQAAMEIVRTAPALADLEEPLVLLQSELTRREVARKGELQAQASFKQFIRLRDLAIFHGMVFEGVDLPSNVAATKQACREALALFGIAAHHGDAPVLPDQLSADQKRKCTAACYELLLVWAEAVAQPAPGLRMAHRASGEEALQLLDRAARIGLRSRPLKAYHQRRATYHDILGDAEPARHHRQLATLTPPSGSLDHYLNGSTFLKQGRLAEGAAEFANALRLEPDHFWARYFLGVCNLLRHPAQARDNFTACMAARSDSDFPWLYLFRGFAHSQLGEFQAAEDDFRRALELKPDRQAQYGILVNRGEMYLRQARLTDQAAASPWPAPFVPNLLLACQGAADVHRQQRLAAGAALLEQATRVQPDQYVAYRYLAQVYQLQKRPDEAVGQLSRALQAAAQATPSVRAQLYGQRARLYWEQGKLDETLQDLGRAVAIVPSPEDHSERGRLFLLRKRYPEAVTAYEAALALRPNDATLFRQKSQALLASRRDKEAAEALSEYLAKGGLPTEDVYRSRGMIRARLRQLPLALADFNQALALRPTSASYTARAWVQLASENRTQAQKDFKESIRLDPENAEAYAGYGLIHAMNGETGPALANANAARALGRPPTARLLWNIAHVHAQLAVHLDFRPNDRRIRAGLTVGRCQERAVELLVDALAELDEKDRPGFWKVYIAADDLLKPLHGVSGFDDLARRYGR